ncbi:MAG TPA: AAA family ATPase, partial [Mycobacterium sp.]|nr:AAA family ATPase [Mycobacterium sp.]
MRFAWPLTGRSEEMQAIEAAMSAPDVAGIVVCGAAGVGKSRIARETLSLAASRGAETNWAIGTSSARGVPLGAFASWVGTAGADNLQVVHRVIRSLTSAAPAIPVVIGVDDAHLIDDLSTFVLQQIVQRGAAKIVLTIRDGEPVPRAIRDIWTGSQFDRLDLQPLSRDETAALVTATLGGSLDPDAEGRLWRLTRGNVLYLCNIVEQEVGDGRLTQKHGLWTWTGEPVVSSTLVELIESRMGAFPCRVSDVIDTVAVGEPVELRALQRITDPEAVEAADTRGLITLDSVEGNVEVRLAHPLYGEVRRRRAPSTKLRRLRGLVAGELAASRNCDDMRNVVRRGALSLDSDVEPDPDLLVRAAQGAVWLADLPLADRLAAAAMRGGAGAEANFIRAHALSWLSRGEEADAVLAGASTTEFSVAEHARLAFLRATNMLWTLADPAGAKQLIDNVSQAHASIDAFRTVYWAAAGKPQSASSAAKNLELTSLPDMVAAVTAWAIAVAAGDAGHTDRAVAAADAGYAVTNRAFDAAHMRFVVADGHIGALVLSGRLAEASDAAERSQKTSADLHGAAQLFSTALAGRAALGGGDLRAACSLLEPVVELLFGSGETNGFGYRYQLSLTIALAMRGLTKEAEAALATLENRRHPSWRYLAYEHALAEAWVAASEGAVTQAIGTMLSAAETAQLNGQLAAEV